MNGYVLHMNGYDSDMNGYVLHMNGYDSDMNGIAYGWVEFCAAYILV